MLGLLCCSCCRSGCCFAAPACSLIKRSAGWWGCRSSGCTGFPPCRCAWMSMSTLAVLIKKLLHCLMLCMLREHAWAHLDCNCTGMPSFVDSGCLQVALWPASGELVCQSWCIRCLTALPAMAVAIIYLFCQCSNFWPGAALYKRHVLYFRGCMRQLFMSGLKCTSSHCSHVCMQYAQRAFLINEFTAGRWQKLPYPVEGPNTPFAGQNLGNGVLSQFGFPGARLIVPGSQM